jgi:hypothetical protein
MPNADELRRATVTILGNPTICATGVWRMLITGVVEWQLADGRRLQNMSTRLKTTIPQLHAAITCERAFEVFKRISDIRAPTLMARHTRGRAIEQLVAGSSLAYTHNLWGSGCAALTLGRAERKPIWSFAHIDIISFLTGAREATGYALTPFCEAKQTDGRRAAQALGYNTASGQLETLAQGWLLSRSGAHVFETAAELPPATRVVYASSAEWDRGSGVVQGCIDDAAGAAALVLCAQALAALPDPVDALFVFADEEEGPVAPGPQAFARGSARLFHRAPRETLPELVTVTDTHDVGQDANGVLRSERFGTGACFAAFGSHARGGVTPPPLLAAERALAAQLAEHDIALVENVAYVGRSDDASAILATPNVALIGCPGAYAHFAQRPRIHIDDLVNLAKSLAALILTAQDAAWREHVLA